MPLELNLPLDKQTAAQLRAGQLVTLNGVLFTARDAAHRRMTEGFEQGLPAPIELAGATIYYAGPTPPPPGRPIGSVGPTTSSRMDAYTPALLERGLAGMVGKGGRGEAVVAAMVRHGAVYFAAIGGAGALLSRCVRAARPVAYEDLGPEAIWRLEVERFPAIVAIDAQGNDWYTLGPAAYKNGSVPMD